MTSYAHQCQSSVGRVDVIDVQFWQARCNLANPCAFRKLEQTKCRSGVHLVTFIMTNYITMTCLWYMVQSTSLEFNNRDVSVVDIVLEMTCHRCVMIIHVIWSLTADKTLIVTEYESWWELYKKNAKFNAHNPAPSLLHAVDVWTIISLTFYS